MRCAWAISCAARFARTQTTLRSAPSRCSEGSEKRSTSFCRAPRSVPAASQSLAGPAHFPILQPPPPTPLRRASLLRSLTPAATFPHRPCSPCHLPPQTAVDFVGKNFELRKADHFGEETVEPSCQFALAVFDPEAGTLQFGPVAGRQVIRMDARVKCACAGGPGAADAAPLPVPLSTPCNSCLRGLEGAHHPNRLRISRADTAVSFV